MKIQEQGFFIFLVELFFTIKQRGKMTTTAERVELLKTYPFMDKTYAKNLKDSLSGENINFAAKSHHQSVKAKFD